MSVSAATRHIKGTGAPRFSVCPSASGATCALGNLPQGQADELQAQVAVRKGARRGDNLTLTATATATDATSFSASGSVKIISTRKPAPAASPSPSASPLPPLPTIPAVPVPLSSGNGTNPSGLFPTVSPQPTTSPAAGSAASHGHSRGVRATSVSETLPLNTRLIGGQLAGLVVLAAAIAIAIARLSLRTPRPQDGKGRAGKQ